MVDEENNSFELLTKILSGETNEPLSSVVPTQEEVAQIEQETQRLAEQSQSKPIPNAPNDQEKLYQTYIDNQKPKNFNTGELEAGKLKGDVSQSILRSLRLAGSDVPDLPQNIPKVSESETPSSINEIYQNAERIKEEKKAKEDADYQYRLKAFQQQQKTGLSPEKIKTLTGQEPLLEPIKEFKPTGPVFNEKMELIPENLNIGIEKQQPIPKEEKEETGKIDFSEKTIENETKKIEKQLAQIAQPKVGSPEAIKQIGEQYKDPIDRLEAAQDIANTNILVTNLAKAASMIGAGFASVQGKVAVKTDLSGFDDLNKQWQQQVQNIKDLSAAQKERITNQLLFAQAKDELALRDPNSPLSKGLATTYSKLLPQYSSAFQGRSGKEIMDNLKIVQFAITDKRNQQMFDLANDKIKTMVQTKQLQQAQQQAKLDDVRWDNYVKAANGQRGNPTIAKLNMRMFSTGNALQIINLVKSDPNFKFNKPLAAETATAIASALSNGGVGTLEQMKTLMPNTVKGDSSSILEYLSNKPQDFASQAHITQSEHTLWREMTNTADQMANLNKRLYDSYKASNDFFDRNKGRDEIAKRYNNKEFYLQTALIDPNPEKAQQIVQWANENTNGDIFKAKQILQKRERKGSK